MHRSQTCAFCQKPFHFDEKFREFRIGPQFCCIEHLKKFVEKFDPLSFCYTSENEIDADPNLIDKEPWKEIFRLGNSMVVNPIKAFAVFDDSDNHGGERLQDWFDMIREGNYAADNRLSKYRCNPSDLRIVVDKEPTVFSNLLNEKFRSSYEVDVIEVMKISWGWTGMLYEPHGIKMFYAGENQERIYIPDWYDPKNVVYFEVKGFNSWDKCSKDKVIALSEIIGWRRMILIHPMYGAEFGKLANQLRKNG
ncbi:PDDEXK family nuclease [Desulfosudis oleivorans]|uniref:Uncharacterized protein n=1 Tax=Desulfosudis oleivorans (strain DSM 6200 / JCM 39069 / Hxd3) TaxID=96561 RepID=A8ZYK9_DESOH|nr:hypothetical protein [Desulfosudis oleivorans]ABW68734.1 hypothetical protein Dole_2931 [Desulfosudis oleivorans Hxd3]